MVKFLFPVGLSSLARHSYQVLLVVEVSSVLKEIPSKTFRRIRVYVERPKGKKYTTIEWDDGENR